MVSNLLTILRDPYGAKEHRMYRVQYRLLGDVMWRQAALPQTLQAAHGQAGALSHSRLADQARVISAGPSRPLDLRA
jgi:hypothetical protein